MTLKMALQSAAIVLGTGLLQLALADSFETTIKASAEHELAAEACESAFTQAEDEALLQAEEHFDGPFSLALSAQEETQRPGADDKIICEFEGTWTGQISNSARELIGTEQSVEGEFSASCLNSSHDDLCWSRIVQQAEETLYRELDTRFDDTDQITLHYTDFEGWQRDRFEDRRLAITADGRFFFSVGEYGRGNAHIQIERSWDSQPQPKPKPPKPAVEAPKQTKPEQPKAAEPSDPLDFTLFYTWDGNDVANPDALAISSRRLGVGLWANNRLGFAVFQGEDQLGIADSDGIVRNTPSRYNTLGVGMGYRLWANRGLTVENMLYFVDAQPFQSNLNPDCDVCTARSFVADDYAQATVNIKTNSRGLNIGWMFTWKIMAAEPSLDLLSSGLYLELQL